ncbi:MAG: hypothetical protein V4622_10630 [Bacteroidota bacterium]
MKKIILLSVIFAFSFLLIPSSLWHECEDLHISHKKGVSDKAHFEKGDCFTCDFQLFPIESQSFTNFKFKKLKIQIQATKVLDFDVIPLFSKSLRGPPQV